jgi:hypothetical protein
VQQNGQLLVVTLTPLHHHDQQVLAGLQGFLEDEVLLTGVATSYPAKSAVVLALQEEATHPEVLGNAGLVVEAILLLPDVQSNTRFLEDCEGSH